MSNKCDCPTERTDGGNPCGEGNAFQQEDSFCRDCAHDLKCCIITGCYRPNPEMPLPHPCDGTHCAECQLSRLVAEQRKVVEEKQHLVDSYEKVTDFLNRYVEKQEDLINHLLALVEQLDVERYHDFAAVQKAKEMGYGK